MNRRYQVAGVAAVLATVVAVAWATPGHADGSVKERLDQGEILVSKVPVEGADYPMIRVQAVIDAPPKVVWDVLIDCEASERTMPRVERSDVVRRIGEDIVCSEKIDMPFPIRDLTSVTRWKFDPGPPLWTKSWTLVDGDFDYANGAWTLRAFDSEGTRTYAKYENHFSPQIFVPAWLARLFLKSGMPSLMEHLRKASAAKHAGG